MNGYELSRKWFDFAFENPEKIKPNHAALYFFAIEHCNRLGWKKKFGLPTEMAKEAVGIRSYNTYIKTLNDLIEWGFIDSIEKSKNQYSSNIIALSNFDKALDKALDKAPNKALDKAFIKHEVKHDESTEQSIEQSIDSINKQINNKQINKKQETKKTSFQDEYIFFINGFNKITGRKFRGDDKTKRQFKELRKKNYTWNDCKQAITNLYRDEFHKKNNFLHATPELLTRTEKFEMFLNAQNTTEKKIYPANINKRKVNQKEIVQGIQAQINKLQGFESQI